jgi:hypothetical protein
MPKVAVLGRVGALLLALGATGLAGLRAEEQPKQEMVPNPPFKHWSAFKPGTTVTRREKVKFPAKSEEGQRYHEGTLVKDTTYKLLEVTPEKVVLEVTEVEHGHGLLTESAPFKLIYLPQIKKGSGTPRESFMKHKQTDVEVEAHGKKYQATLVETSYMSGGVLRTQQIWLSDDMPGGIVKEIKTQKEGDNVVNETTIEVLRFSKAP